MVEEQMLTTAEAARVLDVTMVRVWQLIKDKTLDAKKRGRNWFIYPASLRAHIQGKGEEKVA